jgi:PPOX class probable F420-dependent enzyme
MAVDALGDLTQLPLLATLATHRKDGSVLLSPVWHAWRDGAFEIIIGADDVKMRHLQRNAGAVVLLAEQVPPYRGIEVSGTPSINRDPATIEELLRQVAVRYLGEEGGHAYAAAASAESLALLRLAPGRLRTWDFADELQPSSA